MQINAEFEQDRFKGSERFWLAVEFHVKRNNSQALENGQLHMIVELRRPIFLKLNLVNNNESCTICKKAMDHPS